MPDLWWRTKTWNHLNCPANKSMVAAAFSVQPDRHVAALTAAFVKGLMQNNSCDRSVDDIVERSDCWNIITK